MKWIFFILGITFSLSASWLSAQEAPASVQGVITINSYQAKRLHELGAVFVDVRPYNQWLWGHVDGAYNLDLQDEFQKLMLPDVLDKQTPLVIYGNSSYHMRGAIGSYLAALWGYEKVFFFRSGYYSWLAMDYPVTLTFDDWLDQIRAQP